MARATAQAALLFTLASGVAMAQSPNTCPAIKDDTARLACFDAAASHDAALSTAVYKPVDLFDLKVNKAQLTGSRVEMRGWAIFEGPVLALSVNVGSSLGVYVDPLHLPDVDQKRMLAQCTAEACPVTIRGLVIATSSKFDDVQAESVTFGQH